MSYDKKFRKRVINFIEEGNTWEKAIQVFRVSRDTLRKWLKMYKESGSLEDAPRERSFYKIDPEKVKQYLENYPDAYTREIADALGCSESGIFYVFNKLKITRKKRPKFTKNVTKKNVKYLKTR